MAEESTRRTSKDSVFVKLFGDKKYVRQLYLDLHPEATDVSEDDIEIDTLQSLMVNGLYNDLGFMMKHQYILLVEAQSDWCPNMSLRLWLYLAETYKRYIHKSHQSMHSSHRVILPTPELYVVYSGSRCVPDTVSLRDDFFDGDAPVDAVVKILHTADRTIYGQYIRFCHIFNEAQKRHHTNIACAQETVQRAIEEDCLSEFLMFHKSEVTTMMEQLFDEEVARAVYEESEKRYRAEELKHARDEAIAKGFAKGTAEGFAKGTAEGRAEGRAEGILATAANMLRAGIFTKENIALATGLPIEKINELAAQGV